MSQIITDAISTWRHVRAEFEIVREAAFELAHESCNGVLLNERGKRAGIDPWSLFIGPQVRADCYASEELRDHWRSHARLTFAEFERQYTEQGAAWHAIT